MLINVRTPSCHTFPHSASLETKFALRSEMSYDPLRDRELPRADPPNILILSFSFQNHNLTLTTHVLLTISVSVHVLKKKSELSI